MGIADKKREILKLVEQLHAQSYPGKQIRKSDGRKGAFAPAKISPVKEKPYTPNRESNDNHKHDLLEERLQSIYRQLDERIKNIEHFIHNNLVENESNSPHQKSGINVAINNPNNPSASTRSSQDASDSNNTGDNHPSRNPGLSQKQDYSLGGKIQEGILPDILQLVSSNNKTGVFSLEQNNQKIDLFFDDGSLYHAKADDMVGQNAFFAAMALERGWFYFVETDDIPSEKTIDGNTQFMILEALRQIDEQRNGS